VSPALLPPMNTVMQLPGPFARRHASLEEPLFGNYRWERKGPVYGNCGDSQMVVMICKTASVTVDCNAKYGHGDSATR
jgi:hypothetical protein